MNDASVLLRHASAFPPTHLVIVNASASLHDPIEEMAAFQPSLGVTIVHACRIEDADSPLGEINEAQLIRMLPDLASFELEDPYCWATATYRYARTGLMQTLRSAFKEWAEAHKSERTVVVFVGEPTTPLEAVVLGELPLDLSALFYRRTGALPLVLRVLAAPRRPYEDEGDLPTSHVFGDVDQTYFGLVDYPARFEAYETLDVPSANPFDTTVWAERASEIVPFLREVFRLHGEENAALAPAFSGPGDRDVVPSLEAAMLADGERRRLDWLAFCSTERSPRLWTAGLPALLAALDMRSDRRRAKDPLVSIGRLEREKNFAGNLLLQTYLSHLDYPRPPQEDLARADFPYRITEDDRGSRLEMARHLSEVGEFKRAASLAEELLEDDPDNRLLTRLLGTDLFVAGDRARGGHILRRCIALTEQDPSLDEAKRSDEIATLHHLMRDFEAAVSGYERALEADPLNVHAYQGLVLIHRARGESALSEYWEKAAERRGLALPLVADAEPIEEVFDAPAGEAAPDDTVRERRSKWWSFFKG